ncbi:MAG: zinc-ribbon domain-containing protein [Desulfobacteraceae bacterium]|nr:zinc-ribbon domain-containing protein [Pseudomonadota bacterium]MBU4463656.1 zinc-ribbon domain-containing protein [Pseudomonadota bacterium]MCG2754550.1 zinc-ribbon domain-containing protein [Desulfobacteraceae bacterium]
MIITCEKCYAKFNLDENLLKQTGSKVRCSKCQNIFLAYLPTETEKSAEPSEEMVGSETEEEAKATLETEEETKDVLEIREEELLDLSDIEKTLAIEETPEPETVVKEELEEIDFELDLDTEPVAEKTPEEAEADLEFELEDVDEKKIKKEVAETVSLGHRADQIEKEEVGKAKKRISTPILVALIIALLTGGAYGTYVVLKSMNIKIPFISDLVEPAVQDEAGNLKIIAFDIADKFIDNSKSGKLFIISGKVKNEYSGTRSFIRVTGKLYAKEKVLSKTATICCGNVLSDQDLSDMDMNSINKRLLNPFGDNKSNVNVKPGKELPFMMVFPNIPDNIKEYTVEVAGSSPA